MLQMYLLNFALCAFWISGITLYLLKPFFPFLANIVTYGKLSNTSNERFGFRSLFVWSSYYVSGLIASFVVPFLLNSFQSSSFDSRRLTLWLFRFQTFRRLCECLFVHKFSDRRMPVQHIIPAIGFYVNAALTICISVGNSTSNINIEQLSVSYTALYRAIRHLKTVPLTLQV